MSLEVMEDNSVELISYGKVGDIGKEGWGYVVKILNDEGVQKTCMGTTIKYFDRHFVMEEYKGKGYVPFGIEPVKDFQIADDRAYENTKDKLTVLLLKKNSLSINTEVVDKTSKDLQGKLKLEASN